MKIKIFLIIISIITISRTNAQYYWNGDKKISLEKDFSSLVIYQKETGITENDPNIHIINKHYDNRNGNYKVILLEQSDNTFFSNNRFDAQSYSFGYKKQNGEKVWPNRDILIKPLEETRIEDFENILKKNNASFVGNEYGIIRIRSAKLENAINVANEIYETGKVEWAQPDFLIETQQHDEWEKQYYLNNTDHGYCGFNHDINVPEAWKITRGCENITVAVIDDGVEDHPSLHDKYGNSKVLYGYTPSGTTEYGRPDECGRHGQACAGIIAASHSPDIRGIAPKIKILPVKIRFGTGIPTSEYSNAINWAWENGADVLSNSWGGGDEQIIRNAIENAQTYGRGGNLENGTPGLGAIVVFSSGNDGAEQVGAYAQISVAVGAINKYNTPAKDIYGVRYSNIGINQDIVAYGGDVTECFFDGCAPNGFCECDIRTIDRLGDKGYNDTNFTNGFGGTSAACPQVSGVVALILSINPNLTREEVENILFSTATDMGPAGRDNTYGYGRPDAFRALQETINTLDASTDFFVSEGFLSYEKIQDNIQIIFSNRPHCNISAGTYFCDIYRAESFVPYNTQEWFWYTGDGLSAANPNDGKYYMIKNFENGGERLTTFFYFIETDAAGREVKKWIPNNPEYSWTRKFIAAPQDETISLSNVVVSGERLNAAATESIILEPGFDAEEGAAFSASIVASPEDIICLPNPTKTVLLKETDLPKSLKTTRSEVNKHDNQDKISIHPNPCRGNFFVNTTGKVEQNASIEIFNLHGQLVFNSKLITNNQNISFTDKPGIYLIKVYNGDTVYLNKIILQ